MRLRYIFFMTNWYGHREPYEKVSLGIGMVETTSRSAHRELPQSEEHRQANLRQPTSKTASCNINFRPKS